MSSWPQRGRQAGRAGTENEAGLRAAGEVMLEIQIGRRRLLLGPARPTLSVFDGVVLWAADEIIAN